jgi:hypothetical protein
MRTKEFGAKTSQIYFAGSAGGVTITVVLSPDLPLSPLLPLVPFAPVSPWLPWAPSLPVAPVGPAGPGTGTLTTVGPWSQAARLNAATNADIIIERFMGNPLEVEMGARMSLISPQVNRAALGSRVRFGIKLSFFPKQFCSLAHTGKNFSGLKRVGYASRTCTCGYMNLFKLAIHGTGYPLPGGYDELPARLCITIRGARAG